MIKDAELILVTGRRGSGKSTLTKGLLSGRPKVVVFDPRREYGGRGVTTCDNRKALIAAMRKGWARGFHIAYVPQAGCEAEELHKLTLICWQAQSPYESGADPRKLTLAIEEMDLSFPVVRLPNDLNGMTRVVNQGRHVGIEVIGVTQRPAQISKTFRANVSTTYVFPLADEDDQAAMLKKLSRKWSETLRTLQPHTCLVHDKNAQVTKVAVARNGQIRPISI
tara:strand:- start:6939 stop:7607 length:669 start_codon:yes stop_codon:yes gene_type:complete